MLANGQICSDPVFNIPFDSADKTNCLEINAGYNIGSEALTNRLYKKIVNSSFIDDAAKNSVLPYLKSANNTAGGYANGNIFYSWEPENSKSHLYINLSSRIQYSTQFSADDYKLLMFGNSQFAGQTAAIGGLSYAHYAYQSLQFGFYKNASQKRRTEMLYGGGVALVSGSGYNNLNISKASLYTSYSGDSLSLLAQVSSKSVNTANLFSDINGIGASLNGFLAFKFNNKDELRFQVSDLGFVSWFKNTGRFNFNRQFNYTGEKVSIINGKVSYTNYYLTLDTLATQAGHPPAGGTFVSGLPFQIRLNYTRYLNSTMYLTGGIEYINDNMTIPEIDIAAKRYFNTERFAFHLGFSLFGYSNYGIIAGVEYKMNSKLTIMALTQHLEGFVLNSGTLGQGLFAKLRWTI